MKGQVQRQGEHGPGPPATKETNMGAKQTSTGLGSREVLVGKGLLSAVVGCSGLVVSRSAQGVPKQVQ